MSDNQRKIGSLTGLKALAMLLLFWWHSPIPSPSVDLGARSCEIMFIISGFLVGYNNFYKEVPATWDYSFGYVRRKLESFYPLYFVNIFLNMLVFGGPILTKANLVKIPIHICLIQSWFSSLDISMAYNGPAWFLSSLLFCYFMSPVLLKYAKKTPKSLILLVLTVIVRFSLAFVSERTNGEMFYIMEHTSPVIRCMEFYMGMLLCPLFFKLKDMVKDNMTIFTALEVIVTVGAVIAMIVGNETWPRTIFDLVVMVAVFVYAFDAGVFSKIMGTKPFKWFSDIQFEFYITHAFINGLCGTFLIKYVAWQVTALVDFVAILLVSAVYVLLLKKKMTGLMRRVLEKVWIN